MSIEELPTSACPDILERNISAKSGVVWFFGMPGSGKSTLAGALRDLLKKHDNWVSFLDGDQVRKRLNRDLGFSETDRNENLRRAAEIARLMAKSGSLVIVSFITPLESNRAMVREILDGHSYCECFVKCSLGTCELRDPKGLYARARKGEIPDMTGIGSPFEASDCSEITVDTENQPYEQCMAHLLRALQEKGLIEVD